MGGHPFHLIVSRRGDTFYLRDPEQLLALFAFLAVDPIPVPDWLLAAVDPGDITQSIPRPQRNRRRRLWQRKESVGEPGPVAREV